VLLWSLDFSEVKKVESRRRRGQAKLSYCWALVIGRLTLHVQCTHDDAAINVQYNN